MIISELIVELQKKLEEFGDVPVYVNSHEDGFLEKVTIIEDAPVGSSYVEEAGILVSSSHMHLFHQHYPIRDDQ